MVGEDGEVGWGDGRGLVRRDVGEGVGEGGFDEGVFVEGGGVRAVGVSVPGVISVCVFVQFFFFFNDVVLRWVRLKIMARDRIRKPRGGQMI